MNRLSFAAALFVGVAFCTVAAGTITRPSQAATNSDGQAIFTAHCAACHQQNGQGAGPFPPLAGNPDVTAGDTSALIATLLNGKTGAVTILGKQYSGAMPAWKGTLSNAQIAAVLTYIRSAWTNKAPAVSEDQVALAQKTASVGGAAIFAARCAMCHGARGGGSSTYPPLDGNPDVTAADPSGMIATIVNGRSGPLTVNGKTYNGTMPTWKGMLTNPDIAAVATYIRSAWSNKASGVSEQVVAAAGPAVSTSMGRMIFSQRCVSCHKADGKGGGPFPALAGNKDVNNSDPTRILTIIKDGSGIMPSWKGQLSDAWIAEVASYIRSAWGNNAPPVTEDKVKAIK